MSEPAPDDELVRRYLAGDAGAFSTLMQRHQQRVYSVCLRVLGNRDDAADAVQDAFLSALRKLGQFRGDSLFTTWLYRVAVNACYDILRKRRRQPMLHLAEDPDGPAREEGPAALDHADEVVGTVDAATALARVPEEFRVTLVLADVHDMAYEEISRVLDVPIGTVKSRVHRGRLALARAMGIDAREPLRAPDPSQDHA
ncbi:MAG: sigma-70 family RNA polymerase sigma factor [Actinomycetota bacterium]